MEIVKALFDAEDPNIILYFDALGNSEVKQYPPETPKGRALIKKLGGHTKISQDTFAYSEEIHRENQTYEKFREHRINMTENYAISSLMATALSKEDLMKLKLTMFDNEFVKNSKNREVLVNIRKSEDPIDLIMYFGILRKEANVENKE